MKFVINAGSNSEIESLLVNGVADASAVGQTAFTRTLTVPADATLVAKFKVSTYTSIYNQCASCHSSQGSVPDIAPNFFNSKHWNNHLETGPEFTNQMDTQVNGGNVTFLGTYTDGYLNANDAYTTVENGSTVTCAYRCHFRPGMGPEQNVGTVLADGKSTGYITYTDTTGKYGEVGKAYSRPGGNACMACHDSHYEGDAGKVEGVNVRNVKTGKEAFLPFDGVFVAIGMGANVGDTRRAFRVAAQSLFPFLRNLPLHLPLLVLLFLLLRNLSLLYLLP